MTTNASYSRRGFTLLELLIVIAIIAVLATAGIGGAIMLIERAKRMNASAVCTELEQGISHFYTDHDRLPLELTEDVTISSNSPQGLELLQVLLDEEIVTPTVNIKAKSYLNIQQAEKDINGLLYSDTLVLEGLVDPWGGDYQIHLDGNYDGVIEFKPKGSSSPKRLKRRAAVWTDGRDGVDGTGDAKDDVNTW